LHFGDDLATNGHRPSPSTHHPIRMRMAAKTSRHDSGDQLDLSPQAAPIRGLTDGSVVRSARSVPIAASDAHPAPVPFPGLRPVIGQDAPAANSQATGPGRASPVPAVTFSTFRAPYAERFIRTRSRISRPFHGLAVTHAGSAPPLSAQGQASNDAAGFASSYGPPSCSPQGGLLRWASTGPFPDQAASLLPSLLAATRTGLTPAGDDELMLVSATP
jgi:hypothetical protein